MSIWEYSEYRRYLSDVCEQSKERGLRTQLAAAAGCQPSYLSRALQGRVNLTEEHLVGIAKFLQLRLDETEYLILLLREERAGTQDLRELLAGQRAKLLARQKNLNNRVDGNKPAPMAEAELGLFFSNWIPSAVHLLTSDPAFTHVDAIAERLHLPVAKVTETMRFLERAGLVEHTKSGWRYAKGSFHLPKNSPWQAPFQASRRELALRSITQNPRDAVHFSSMFTISPEDLRELGRIAAEFVEKAQARIHASGTERLGLICLDVFEVV